MTPQIKICGFTRADQALACAQAGADAIGLVFYPLSPRFVSLETAKEICTVLPANVASVGVFVDEPVESMIKIARMVGLRSIQLHGNESSFTVHILKSAGFHVIKVLRFQGPQLLMEAAEYALADSLLVEASKGQLPGGNGAVWQWSGAQPLAHKRPIIVAGGLHAENVAQALAESEASGVDLSSGAESGHGHKDIIKIKAIISAVRAFTPVSPIGEVFP
jgi:phosphoribosylanthranilate isomerase